jgi:hypothetical protein
MLRKTVSSIVTALALAAVARAHGSSVNITMNSDRIVRTCEDIRIEFDHRPARRAEDAFKLPAASPLRVRLPANSGIRVRGTDRSDFAVTVCKAAPRAEDLEAIRVSPESSGLAFHGPRAENWVTYLLVEAPRDAELDLEARNGSIGVDGTAGKIAARTTNGPIGLSNCSGAIDANAQNGPISIEDCTGTGEARAVNGPVHISGDSGTYRLSTQNGPISVELAGDRWKGSLDARAVNGPLTLKIADGYRSGVVVETTGHGPVSCPDSACRGSRRTFDDDSRRIEFGDSEPVVRLSTRNGPVSIERAD